MDEEDEMNEIKYNQELHDEDMLYDVGDLGVLGDDGSFVKGKDCQDCIKSLTA